MDIIRTICSFAAAVFFLAGQDIAAETADRPVRVACVGNSITYGAYIPDRDRNSYPAQLQAWLGDGYEVGNFGYSGSTLLRNGDYPYFGSDAHVRSLAFRPDIVLIMLGTNDSKPWNWKYADEFEADMTALIDSYRQLPVAPRIILMTPPNCFLPESDSIDDGIIKEIGERVRNVAGKESMEVIDTYGIFPAGRSAEMLSDKLHPTPIGAGLIAVKAGKVIDPRLAAVPAGIHPVPGNEFRSGAGWFPDNEWHSVADDITATLQGRHLKLLLLGDSITQGWGGDRKAVSYKPGLDAMNNVLGKGTWESAGISGDKTQNLLWRLRNCGYDCCDPENVVIAIGINNLIAGDDSPEDVAEGITAVTAEAEKLFPDADIILLGLFPAGKEPDSEIRSKCDRIHGILAATKFARAHYFNPTGWLTDSNGFLFDGLYSGDSVHLTPKGYEVLAGHIGSLL